MMHGVRAQRSQLFEIFSRLFSACILSRDWIWLHLVRYYTAPWIFYFRFLGLRSLFLSIFPWLLPAILLCSIVVVFITIAIVIIIICFLFSFFWYIYFSPTKFVVVVFRVVPSIALPLSIFSLFLREHQLRSFSFCSSLIPLLLNSAHKKCAWEKKKEL